MSSKRIKKSVIAAAAISLALGLSGCSKDNSTDKAQKAGSTKSSADSSKDKDSCSGKNGCPSKEKK